MAGERTPETAPWGRWMWLLSAVWLVLAAVLRVLSARGELWLDEIWSLQLAHRLPTPLHALLLRHDNNHIANTIWLAIWPAQLPAFVYRIPAVLAGVASVLLAGLFMRRRGYAVALSAMALCACAVLLVHYGSEARGYSPAVGFVLLALLSLEERVAGAAHRTLPLLFGLAVVAALLSHLSSFAAYAALFGYWFAARLPRLTRAELVREGLAFHTVPLLMITGLGLVFASSLKIGGGFSTGRLETLRATAGFLFGVQGDGALGVAACAAAAVIAALGLGRLWRRARPRAVLYALGLTIPVVTMLWHDPRHLAPRYLLFSALFFLLLTAEVLGEYLRGNRVQRAVAGLGVLAMIGGNLRADADLIAHGRGSYRAAIAQILRASPSGPISVTSDNDFRNPALLSYHAQTLPDARRLRYYGEPHYPASGTDWLILHRIGNRGGAPPRKVIFRGHRFTQTAAYPSAPLSGMSWYVYRRRADR